MNRRSTNRRSSAERGEHRPGVGVNIVELCKRERCVGWTPELTSLGRPARSRER